MSVAKAFPDQHGVCMLIPCRVQIVDSAAFVEIARKAGGCFVTWLRLLRLEATSQRENAGGCFVAWIWGVVGSLKVWNTS